jgi:hypothetical protein
MGETRKLAAILVAAIFRVPRHGACSDVNQLHNCREKIVF